MNINDAIKVSNLSGISVEDVIKAVERINKYFSEQVESAKMDVHSTNNDPIEVDLHLTRTQAQALRDVLAHVGGFGARRELVELIADQLEEQGYEFDGHEAGDLDGEIEFL